MIMYADVADLVISRNVYDDTTDIAHKKLAQIVDRSVKVAAGTPPVDIAPGWMDWIQKNPSEQGTVLGAQLAAKTLAHLRGLKDRLPIAALIREALSRTGYDALLVAEFLGERKLANLRKLIDQARALLS